MYFPQTQVLSVSIVESEDERRSGEEEKKKKVEVWSLSISEHATNETIIFLFVSFHFPTLSCVSLRLLRTCAMFWDLFSLHPKLEEKRENNNKA